MEWDESTKYILKLVLNMGKRLVNIEEKSFLKVGVKSIKQSRLGIDID